MPARFLSTLLRRTAASRAVRFGTAISVAAFCAASSVQAGTAVEDPSGNLLRWACENLDRLDDPRTPHDNDPALELGYLQGVIDGANAISRLRKNTTCIGATTLHQACAIIVREVRNRPELQRISGYRAALEVLRRPEGCNEAPP